MMSQELGLRSGRASPERPCMRAYAMTMTQAAQKRTNAIPCLRVGFHQPSDVPRRVSARTPKRHSEDGHAPVQICERDDVLR